MDDGPLNATLLYFYFIERAPLPTSMISVLLFMVLINSCKKVNHMTIKAPAHSRNTMKMAAQQKSENAQPQRRARCAVITAVVTGNGVECDDVFV